MKENNEIKIGAILSYIIIGLNMVVGIAYTPILTNMLGQSEYGLYSLVNTIMSYLTILDLGFGNAIIIYTTKYKNAGDKEKENKLHGMFLIIYTIIGIVATLLGIILYLNTEKVFSNSMSISEIATAKKLILILTFNMAITFPFSIFSSIITAYEKFIFAKVLNIVRIILMPAIMIPLLFLGYKSVALVIVLTILNIGVLLSNFIYCKKKLSIKMNFKNMDRKLLVEIFCFSFWIFLNTIVYKLNWSVDEFILGTVSGTVSVAIYSVANQLHTIYSSFAECISNILLPKVTKMEANYATDEEYSNIFIRVGRLQFFVMALILSGFVIYGNEFITKCWVGEQYADSYIIACILMIPLFVPLIQNVGLNILQVKNKYKYRTIVCLIIAVVNVIISIPLAMKLGGIGSAIGTALSMFVGQVIIMNWYYWKKIKLDIPRFWKNIFILSIPLIGVMIIGILIKNILEIKGILTLGINITIYVSIYAAFMYKFVMNKDEKNMVSKPIKKIINKFYRVRNKVEN